MQLLIIRHAYAGDREKFALTGLDDNLRPLTREGCRHMQRAARVLRDLVPELGILATGSLSEEKKGSSMEPTCTGILGSPPRPGGVSGRAGPGEFAIHRCGLRGRLCGDGLG